MADGRWSGGGFWFSVNRAFGELSLSLLRPPFHVGAGVRFFISRPWFHFKLNSFRVLYLEGAFGSERPRVLCPSRPAARLDQRREPPARRPRCAPVPPRTFP